MKKILISVSTIALVAAVTFAATSAYFSDTETSAGNTFTAGSLDLKVDGADLTGQALITVSNVKPGDSGSDEGTVSNAGTTNGYLYLGLDQTANDENGQNEPELAVDTSADVGELCSALVVKISMQGQEEDGWDVKYTGPVVDVPRIYLGTLNGNETKNYKVEYSVPTEVGNEIQSDVCTFSLNALLSQVEINPTFTLTHASGQNALNKANNHPYIDWSIDGDTITFTFVNPTDYLFAFDYRVDGEAGTTGSWSSTVIHGGELDGQLIGDYYNVVNVPAHTQQVRTVTGTNEIWTGLRLGAENDWYLDWIKFNVN